MDFYHDDLTTERSICSVVSQAESSLLDAESQILTESTAYQQVA